MSNKDNLQKTFEKAFEDHQEPLSQAQWDRLDSVLARKNSKFRFLPWILGLVAFAILCSSIGFWLGNTNQSKKELSTQNAQNKIILSDKSQSDKSLNSFKNKNQNNTQNENQNNINNKNIKTEKGEKTLVEKRNSDEKRITSKINLESSINKNNINVSKKDHFKKNSAENFEPDNFEKNKSENNNSTTNPTLLVNNKTKDLEKNIEKYMNKDSIIKLNKKFTDTNVNSANNNDSTKSEKPKDSPKGDDKNKNYRFAIGFTTGISLATYKNVSFEKSENMHTDTRSIFDNNVKKTSTTFYNLFFDFKVFRNISLSLNSGIQYRELKSEENTNYALRQIAFRNQDGSINTYIPDTSQNPLVFTNKSINTTKYISVPLSFSYFVSFKQKNEIQFTAGVIANQLVAASGKTFSLNDFDAVDYKTKLNTKITLGYLGGINYFRQIYRPFWLGIGCQMQQNKLQMNTNYGYIKSNINITNYTINIKYKF